jgi:type II secretory pathway pseudopilin PulG
MALLLLLIAVAVIGLASATVVQVGAQVSRRDAEEELVNVGQEFQRAIRSYVDSTPGQAVLGPRSLHELLKDPRVPGLRRHLRGIPVDPMTGRFEWGLAKSPDGQIIGVFSLAEGTPIRQTGFEPPFAHLNEARTYQGWVFGVALPASTPVVERRKP